MMKKNESIIGNRAFGDYNGLQCRMWKWKRAHEGRNRSGYSGRGRCVSAERKAELSFITSAPATSTQDPNERTIFKRMEKQTNVHIDWTCFVSDQFDDKRIWHWHSSEIFRMVFLTQE